MILLKSARSNYIEGSTDLGLQYSFPIIEPRLLGEMTDFRTQRGNIEEESGGSYCVKKEVLKN